MTKSLDIVILGLSITSSWGNGHASTFRALVSALSNRGHNVLFLERDVPWYSEHRDLPNPPYGRTQLYKTIDELRMRFRNEVRDADLCIVGSYVPDGSIVGGWVTHTTHGVTAFYDIDTPITVTKLAYGDTGYITPRLVREYDLYLSFTGGPILRKIEKKFGARKARTLYCSFDPKIYFPEREKPNWDLGYMGTYSKDRQSSLDLLLIQPARQQSDLRAVVAGSMYPSEVNWPKNVARIEHLPPEAHRRFYNAQRFTLNVTRADMIKAGYSPSVRLFEAAACGTPIITDYWPGLEKFFKPHTEILPVLSGNGVLDYLRNISEEHRLAIGDQARTRVLREHTPEQRVIQLEGYVGEVMGQAPQPKIEVQEIGALA